MKVRRISAVLLVSGVVVDAKHETGVADDAALFFVIFDGLFVEVKGVGDEEAATNVILIVGDDVGGGFGVVEMLTLGVQRGG